MPCRQLTFLSETMPWGLSGKCIVCSCFRYWKVHLPCTHTCHLLWTYADAKGCVIASSHLLKPRNSCPNWRYFFIQNVKLPLISPFSFLSISVHLSLSYCRQYHEALENYKNIAQQVKSLNNFIRTLDTIINERLKAYAEFRRQVVKLQLSYSSVFIQQ